MNVIEMPASEPSSAARGVIFRTNGADEAADHQHEALHEHPREPGLPGLHRIPRLREDRQHHDERDHEHVRNADAGRQRAHIVAAGLLREPIAQPRVVQRAQAQHRARCGQDAAEDQIVGQLQHEAQQSGHHQQVDEDVGAEAEEGIQVARRPRVWAGTLPWCAHAGAPC